MTERIWNDPYNPARPAPELPWLGSGTDWPSPGLPEPTDPQARDTLSLTGQHGLLSKGEHRAAWVVTTTGEYYIEAYGVALRGCAARLGDTVLEHPFLEVDNKGLAMARWNYGKAEFMPIAEGTLVYDYFAREQRALMVTRAGRWVMTNTIRGVFEVPKFDPPWLVRRIEDN